MIKFRAWIKTGIETYDYVKPMTIQQMIHSKKSTFSLKQLNDLVDFEQFTGLIDANGKDIYEGDIVHSKVPGLSGLGIVQWNSESACFELNDIRRHTSKRGYRKYPFYRDGVYRIDGNAHENPELLEAQHDTRTD